MKLKNEGFNVSSSGIYYFLKKYKETGSIFDKPRCGRPKSLPAAATQHIETWLQENDDITINEIVAKLNDMGYSTSKSTVFRVLVKAGWTAKPTRYCQLIREQNKLKRLQFCQDLLVSGESFQNVIFTDETMVQLTPVKRKTFHKKGEPRRYKAKPKHPLKVYVWGGISKRGATSCVIFTDIMDAERYTRILAAGLLPFVCSKFPDGNYRLQQDNDPKHTSRIAREFFNQNHINWWKTPAESPDFNPIERVWNQLKQFLTHTVRPTNKQELVNGIKLFWSMKLTIEQCVRYINHLHRVIPVIINKDGNAVIDDEV